VSELEGLVKGLASQLGKTMRDHAKRAWDDVPDAYKDEVEQVLKDSAELTIRSLGGEDVTGELLHVKAQMLSWGFVGASQVRTAIKAALEEAAVFAGKVLMRLVI
jgi:hypothetical protein